MLQQSSVVDREWLHTVVTRIQVDLVPVAWAADVDDVRAAVTSAAQALPAPRNHAESLILRSLLFDVASRCGTDVHRRVQARWQRVADDFEPAAVLERCWTDSEQDPRQILAAWADAFFPAFIAQHPPSPAARAANVLRQHYSEAWTASSLARRLAVGVAASQRCSPPPGP